MGKTAVLEREREREEPFVWKRLLWPQTPSASNNSYKKEVFKCILCEGGARGRGGNICQVSRPSGCGLLNEESSAARGWDVGTGSTWRSVGGSASWEGGRGEWLGSHGDGLGMTTIALLF